MRSVTMCSVQTSAVAAMVFLLLVSFASSWPSGAPETACSTLTPRHGENVGKTASSSPFTVTQSQSNFASGDRVKVVVRAPNGVSFKGLIVQAFDTDSNQPIGVFEPGRGLKTIDSCSAVTHSDPRGKRSATLVWDAPQSASGRVSFKMTIVKRFSEFWTGIGASENPNV